MNLQVFAEFRLHGGEEHFHHGVVVAIPPAAHAAGNAVRREQPLITLRMPVLLSRGSRRVPELYKPPQPTGDSGSNANVDMAHQLALYRHQHTVNSDHPSRRQ
jgi:hypothetical protein